MLNDLETVQVFVQMASHNEVLRDGVRELEISPLSGHPLPPSLVRDALFLCPKITHLSISLPYAPASGVLTSTFLRDLGSFSTTLAHNIVVPFLKVQGHLLTKLVDLLFG